MCVCGWVGGGGWVGGKHFPASFGGVMVSVCRNKHIPFTNGDVKGLGCGFGGWGSKRFLTTFGIYVKVSVCMWVGATLRVKLQTLIYDIRPSTTAVFIYAIGSRKLSANKQFCCCCWWWWWCSKQ